MLQSNMLPSERSPLAVEDVALDQAKAEGLDHLLRGILAFIRQQYLVILLATLISVGAGYAYLKITPPTYQAQAKILFGNPKTQFVQQQSVLADPPADAAQIESQVQVIESKAIATTVIKQLNLANDPDFNGSTPSFLTLLMSPRNWFGSAPPPPAEVSDGEPSDDLIAAFDDRLSASRLGISNVIEITYKSSSPTRAAEVANAVAKAYINDQLTWRLQSTQAATEWLQDRLKTLGKQALASERAVDAFKHENNIVSADGKPIDDQRVAELNSRLVAARAQTAEALARLNRYQSLAQASAESLARGADPSTDIETPMSEVLNSPIITALRQQYLELSRREGEWSARYGRNHQAVANLRSKMKDIRASIVEEVKRIGETSRGDYIVAQQKQAEAEKQLAQAIAQSRNITSAELTMRELDNNSKSYRSLYENFLQRYTSAIQQASFPLAEARIISPASPPPGKSKPKSAMIMVIALFGGIGAGCALGFLRGTLDRVFRTQAEIEDNLRLNCLSLVPMLKDNSPPRPRPRLQRVDPKTSSQVPRLIAQESGIFWTAANMPLSPYAESIRAIKLAIDLNLPHTNGKIIGLTSALPDEGKSTVAAGLAQLIGRAGRRVLLVDCDLRNPSLSARLAPRANTGLLEVLNGQQSVDETVWHAPQSNMTFMPVVAQTPVFNASEILSSDRAKALFENLRDSFDYIIVDLPPLAPVIDARATSSLVDCFVLVVEWGKTKIEVVQHALHNAQNVSENVLGVALTKTNMKALKRYSSHHRDYYNDRYYHQYTARK